MLGCLSLNIHNKFHIFFIGWFKILHVESGKPLTIVGGDSGGEGELVCIRRDQSTDNQLWMWQGNCLLSKHRGYCMDLMDAKSGKGTNVEAWHHTNDMSQQWKLEYMSDGDQKLYNFGVHEYVHVRHHNRFKLQYVSRKSQSTHYFNLTQYFKTI